MAGGGSNRPLCRGRGGQRGARCTTWPPSTAGRSARERATLPEYGRGLAIMRACVDDVALSSGPGRATVVSLQKRMDLRTDAMLAGPAAGQLRDAG